MSSETKLSRRNLITIGLIVLAVPAVYLGLRQRNPGQDPATSAIHRPDVPGGGVETAFLDGMKVGDEVAGFRVAFVGAPRDDGLMLIEFEQNGTFARIVVGLLSAEPLPPAATAKYAVYFERVHDKQQATPEQASRLADAVASRIRKGEEKVPAPSGLKAMKKAGKPM